MICTNCGTDNAADARYCTRCGAELPRAAVRPGRGRTIVVVASCIIAALVGYGGWRLAARAPQVAEPPRSSSGAVPVPVPTGSAPPPTDQSAAPLPPPSALPGTAEAAPGPVEGAATSGTAASGEANTVAAGTALPAGGAAAAAANTSPSAADASASAAGAGSKSPSPTSEAARAATRAHMPRPHAAAPARVTPPPPSAPPPAKTPAKQLAAAAPPTTRLDDHWTQMSNDLSRCTREDFINRVICDQRVRIRYCDGYWGKVAQCPVSPSTQDVR